MFGIIKNMFIFLLSNVVNGSNHTKCVSLSYQKCMIQPTLINYPMQLNQIDVLEVVIFLITYLIKYVFQIKQKI